MQTALYKTSNFMQPPQRKPERTVTDQEAIRQRVKRIMHEKADNRQGVLAEMAGIQPGTLSKQLNGSESLTRKNLQKIEQATGVRLAWLENGVEPIYHPGGVAPVSTGAMGEGARLKAYLKKVGIRPVNLAKMIDKTKSTVSGYFTRQELEVETHRLILTALHASEDEVFGAHVQASTLSTLNTQPNKIRDYVPNQEDSVQITRIPVRARAGFEYDAYFSDQSESETRGVRRDLIRQNFDLAMNYNKIALIEIDGDSMEPLLRPGYEVIGYLVDPSDWPYQTQVVAVSFRDQFVVKRILDNGLLMTGMLTLTSDNPSGGSIMIPVNEIHKIWKIDRITNGKL